MRASARNVASTWTVIARALSRALRSRLFTIIVRDQKPPDFRSLRSRLANCERYQPLSRIGCALMPLLDRAPIESVNCTVDR